MLIVVVCCHVYLQAAAVEKKGNYTFKEDDNVQADYNVAIIMNDEYQYFCRKHW